MRRRPAAAHPLRRPAARGEAGLSAEDKWKAGEEVKAEEFAPGLIGSGDWIQSCQAVYFEQPCEFAGIIEKVVLEGTETELVVRLSGTSSEGLLKYATVLQPPVVRAHLCPPSCDQRRSNQDLLHLKSFRRFDPAGEKTWQENLKGGDENEELRRQQGEWERGRAEKRGAEEVSSDSRGEGEKRKKKDKKVRKEKKKSKKTKVGGKTLAKKEAAALYAGTGLDPDSRVRRRVRRKVRRKLKKTRSSSSSSSRTTSSTSSGEVDEQILEDRSKVQKLAEWGPGVLTAGSLQHMKSFVMQASGSTWEVDQEVLPPIMSQYVRSYVAARASGGLLREAGDLLVQSRPAEALDALSQRLKSLEMVTAGQSWSVAQKIEVVPAIEASMASRAELQLAHREAQLDSKARGSQSGAEKGKSKGKTKDKDRGKDKGKGGSKSKEEARKTS